MLSQKAAPGPALGHACPAARRRDDDHARRPDAARHDRAHAALADPADPFSDAVETTTSPAAGDAQADDLRPRGRDDHRRLAVRRRSGRPLDAQGRVTAVTPAAGQDAADLRLRREGPVATRIAQGTQSMTYAYDAPGPTRRRVTDAGGATVTYAYDAADRAASETFPGGRTYAYAYARRATRHDHRAERRRAPLHGRRRRQRDGLSRRPAGAGYTRRLRPRGRAHRTRRSRPAPLARPPTTPQRARDGHDLGLGDRQLELPRGRRAAQFRHPRRAGARPRLTTASCPRRTASAARRPARSTSPPEPTSSSRKITLTSGADTRETAFAYDDDGLATTDGPLTLTRGGTGQASALTDGTLHGTYGHDGVGRLTTRTLDGRRGHALRPRLTYDSRGRVATRKETIAGTATTLTYGYDDTGELTSGVGRRGLRLRRRRQPHHAGGDLRRRRPADVARRHELRLRRRRLPRPPRRRRVHATRRPATC